MKIGFDAKRFYHNASGLGNYSRDLINGVLKIFPNNKYFLFNPKEKKEFNFNPNDNISNYTEIIPKGIMKKLHSLWRYKKITKLIIKNKLDVYHGLSAELPKGIHKIPNLKKIVTIHDLIFIRFPELYNKFDVISHTKKVKYACEVADKIIAISTQTKNDIIEFLNIDEGKIEVVYQSCNDAYLKEYNGTYKVGILEKYNLPEKYILSVGTIEKRKNLLTVIKALNNLPKEIGLIAIGRKTDYQEELIKYIDEHNLNNRIWFLQNLSVYEIAAIYQMAGVFIYPSIFEGFGIPIIESLFCKTPVITSNVSSLPEVAGEYSIKISPYDSDTLKDKILEIMGDFKLHNKMVDEGYKFAVKNFSKEKIIKEVYKLYDKEN